MMNIKVILVDIDSLKLHEYIDIDRLTEILKSILKDGFLHHPVVVDRATNVVLDGAHRVSALKLIGCRYAPVVYVDYSSPDIRVVNWRSGENISKDDVIKAGLSELKFPPKSTKHLIRVGDDFQHISVIERRVDIPIEELFGDNPQNIFNVFKKAAVKD